MEDDRIKNKLSAEVQISQDWLTNQRNRLMGAIDRMEEQSAWSKLSEYFLSHRKLRPLLQFCMLILVFVVGYFTGHTNPVAKSQFPQLEDLLSQGRVTDVKLAPSDWASGNLNFILTEKNKLFYSGDKEDAATLQLLHFMLKNTKNEGRRQELVNEITKADFNSDLALETIARALFDEDNLAIQLELLSGLADSDKPIVKQALLGIALGEYPDPLRLRAVQQIRQFSDDEYIRMMLGIIAVSDSNSSIQYTAREILGETSVKGGEIAK